MFKGIGGALSGLAQGTAGAGAPSSGGFSDIAKALAQRQQTPQSNSQELMKDGASVPQGYHPQMPEGGWGAPPSEMPKPSGNFGNLFNVLMQRQQPQQQAPSWWNPNPDSAAMYRKFIGPDLPPDFYQRLAEVPPYDPRKLVIW